MSCQGQLGVRMKISYYSQHKRHVRIFWTLFVVFVHKDCGNVNQTIVLPVTSKRIYLSEYRDWDLLSFHHISTNGQRFIHVRESEKLFADLITANLQYS